MITPGTTQALGVAQERTLHVQIRRWRADANGIGSIGNKDTLGRIDDVLRDTLQNRTPSHWRRLGEDIRESTGFPDLSETQQALLGA